MARDKISVDFCFQNFVCSFEREREHKQGREGSRQREKQMPP